MANIDLFPCGHELCTPFELGGLLLHYWMCARPHINSIAEYEYLYGHRRWASLCRRWVSGELTVLVLCPVTHVCPGMCPGTDMCVLGRVLGHTCVQGCVLGQTRVPWDTRVHVFSPCWSRGSSITAHVPVPPLQPPAAELEESEQPDSEEVQSPLKTPPPKPAPLEMEEATTSTCIVHVQYMYFILPFIAHRPSTMILMHTLIFVPLGCSCKELLPTSLYILALIFL